MLFCGYFILHQDYLFAGNAEASHHHKKQDTKITHEALVHSIMLSMLFVKMLKNVLGLKVNSKLLF